MVEHFFIFEGLTLLKNAHIRIKVHGHITIYLGPVATITDNQSHKEEKGGPDNTANEDIIDMETGKANDAKPDLEKDAASPEVMVGAAVNLSICQLRRMGLGPRGVT